MGAVKTISWLYLPLLFSRVHFCHPPCSPKSLQTTATSNGIFFSRKIRQQESWLGVCTRGARKAKSHNEYGYKHLLAQQLKLGMHKTCTGQTHPLVLKRRQPGRPRRALYRHLWNTHGSGSALNANRTLMAACPWAADALTAEIIRAIGPEGGHPGAFLLWILWSNSLVSHEDLISTSPESTLIKPCHWIRQDVGKLGRPSEVGWLNSIHA